MLSDAIRDIRLAQEDERRRRLESARRRHEVRKLDAWLHHIECLLEENRRTVPEPLVREIATFVRGVSPKLHRSLLRNRERQASRVLDILFDTQQLLLPGFESPEADAAGSGIEPEHRYLTAAM